MRIRYFAGAAEAAGVTEESITDDRCWSMNDLVTHLSRDRARLAAVFGVASILVNGRAVRDREDEVPLDAQVDVLPPFAGG